MSRTLVVCLDGTSFERLDQLDEELFVNRMREKGVEAEFHAPIPQTAPSAVSIMSGMNPGKTGVYRFEAGKSRIAKAKDITVDRLWDYLDRSGISHSILHVPLTYPTQESGEVFASGKLTPSADSNYVIPEKMQENFEFPYDAESDGIEGMKERIGARFNNLENTLEAFESELVFLWIDETDNVQHYNWEQQQNIDKVFEFTNQKLEKVYKEDDFDNLVIISDHGFGPVEPRNFHINSWLRDKGYLETSGSKSTTSLKTKMYKLGKEYLPDTAKRFIRKRLMSSGEEENGEAIAPVPGVDWSETRAFYDKGWGVKIIEENLDQKFETFRTHLMDEIESLEDEEGDKVFQKVKRGEEVYHGPRLEQANDVYLMPSEKYYLTRMLKKRWFDSEEIQHKKKLSGNHNAHPDGIFIATGKDFGEGELEKMESYDFLPTVLQLYGIQIPANVDGEVIEEAFDENFVSPDTDSIGSIEDMDI